MVCYLCLLSWVVSHFKGSCGDGLKQRAWDLGYILCGPEKPKCSLSWADGLKLRVLLLSPLLCTSVEIKTHKRKWVINSTWGCARQSFLWGLESVSVQTIGKVQLGEAGVLANVLFSPGFPESLTLGRCLISALPLICVLTCLSCESLGAGAVCKAEPGCRETLQGANCWLWSKGSEQWAGRSLYVWNFLILYVGTLSLWMRLCFGWNQGS